MLEDENADEMRELLRRHEEEHGPLVVYGDEVPDVEKHFPIRSLLERPTTEGWPKGRVVLRVAHRCTPQDWNWPSPLTQTDRVTLTVEEAARLAFDLLEKVASVSGVESLAPVLRAAADVGIVP